MTEAVVVRETVLSQGDACFLATIPRLGRQGQQTHVVRLQAVLSNNLNEPR